MNPGDGARETAGTQPASAAAAVRARIEAGGERLWTAHDFQDLSSSAVLTTLHRLVHEGVLRRERKGVYYRPRETRFGSSSPVASAAAAASIRAPVHPAGLTAANALGFTTQNPFRAEYATTAPSKPRALRDATVYTRRPAARANLTPKQGALLEFLRERAATSDLPPAETQERLLLILGQGDTFATLARAAAAEPPRVRAMLGALGEQLQVDRRDLKTLRDSLNPASTFDFGVLGGLPAARSWQAK